MSARSSRRSRVATIAAVAAIAGACGKKPAPKPEADPAKAKELALVMVRNTPSPGSARTCAQADLDGTQMTMTFNTLMRIAGVPLENDPEHADWINPAELDHPAARVLVDPKAERTAARQAAAELFAAPFVLVYRVENVDAPIAIGVKELKIGTIGSRVIRYAMNGTADCVLVFLWQNTPEKNAWAIEKSDRAVIDPAVAKAMQDDLVSEYLKKRPRPAPPATKP